MAYSFVGSKYAAALTTTYSPTHTNDLQIFAFAGRISGTVTFTLADNLGTTYSIGTATTTTNSYVCASWYLQNCPAGITTFTVTASGGTVAGGNSAILVGEWSGLTGSFLGSSAFTWVPAPGSSANAIVSGAINITTQPTGLTSVVYNPSFHPCTAGTSPIAFTSRFSTTGDAISLEDARITSTGNASATWTTGNAFNNFVVTTMAFAESSGGNPAITSVNSGNPIHPADTGIVISGSNFGGSTGTVNLIDGTNSSSQTITSWGASSITITVAQGNVRYGIVTLQVTTTGALSAVISVTLSPVSGVFVTNIGILRLLTYATPTSGLPTPSRLYDSPDISNGSQVEYTVSSGSGTLSIDVDGRVSWVPAVKQMQWRWIAGTGSGTWTSLWSWDLVGLFPSFIGPNLLTQTGTQNVAIQTLPFAPLFLETDALEVPLGYTVSAGTLPTGLGLDSGGNLTGTPTGTGTSSGIVVRAANQDASYVETNAFDFIINASGLDVTFTGVIPDQSLTVGTFFRLNSWTYFNLAINYAITTGTLPDGIAINTISAGVISGIPTGLGITPGDTQPYTVVVTGSNSQPSSAPSNSFTLNVLNPLPLVTVPNVIGDTQAVGTAALQALTFVVIAQMVPSLQIPGLIVNQSQAPGTEVPPGWTIIINVSQLDPNAVLMPSVVGMGWIDASKALSDAGLSQNNAPNVIHSSDPPVVIAQFPLAGVYVLKNTEVLLTVKGNYLLAAAFPKV